MRKLPTVARIIYTEEGRRLTLHYVLLVEETADGLECYGVRITEESTSNSASVSNLIMSVQKIYDFIELLANNLVTPIGLMDVVTDWL